MIKHQILQTNITGAIWQTVRRITHEILGVKGLTTGSHVTIYYEEYKLYLSRNVSQLMWALVLFKKNCVFLIKVWTFPSLPSYSCIKRSWICHYSFTSCSKTGRYAIQSYVCRLNPLHTNISMHILHTVLYTFPKVLAGRICLIIESVYY